jgi:hypothetical protein
MRVKLKFSQHIQGGVFFPMKAISLYLSVTLVGLVASLPVHGQVVSSAFATSPDHPGTWVVGASNIHQDLRWDDERRMLVADVTYSTRDWADSMHPTHESEYTLAFPSVHLNSSSQSLTAGGTHIGTLTHGIFGTNVKLDPNVQLNIHRLHGKIFGAIASLPQR